jgi:hypothetical protein
MAELYLSPEDVSAEHARQVLDFLNQAANARVIADAVEFPHERDVGIRVGQRIINRRNELHGFHTLYELRAVPYVGPERFTEIVVALSGARARRGGAGATPQPIVQARLWSVQDTIWLGQNATVLVQLNDASGRALIDLPMTIATSWGELTARNGVQTISNNAVVTRSNDAGVAELRLRVRFQAPLSDAQRLALELAAGRLPTTASLPTAASDQLSDLVARYRAPGSDDLREAIDAAFREYAASVEQAQHRGQALAEWPRLPVSIVCFVHDEADERGNQHLALATHTLNVRNWLPAFLATFEHDVAADGRLAAELNRTPRDITDANVFLNDVFVNVQAFLNTERGQIGQAIRARVAKQELQQFLQSNVPVLPADVQVRAAGGVQEASRTIGDGGLTLFTAVDATRRDSKLTVDLSAGLLATRLGALESTAATTQQLDALRSEILAQTHADLMAGLLDAQATLKAQIQQVADLQTSLSQQVTQLSQQISLKADLSTVNTLQASVKGLNTRITDDLSTVSTRLDGIETRIGRG